MACVHSSGRLEEPSSFEATYAWRGVIEPGSTPIVDALITSCVDEDVRSFSLQDSPSVIEEHMEVVVPNFEAQQHVGAPKSSMRASVPLRRYASHVALVSSIRETSSCIEEERCDDKIYFIHDLLVV